MCRMFGSFGQFTNDKAIQSIEYLRAGGPDEQNIRFLNA